MAWMVLFLVITPAVVRSQQGDTFQFQCKTADEEHGTCTPIRSCQPFVELLTKRKNDPEVVDYMRKSVCWTEKKGPVVCCPQKLTRFRPEPECGVPTASHNKIVNGAPSVLGAWPWLAALVFTTKADPSIRHFGCSGTLISEKHVLTAAHCVDHPPLILIAVHLGDLNLDPKIDDGATPVDIPVESIISHPGYRSETFHIYPHHDIAILRLKYPAKFNDDIKPICLPAKAELRTNSFERKFPFVAGWGDTSHNGVRSNALLEVQLPVVNHESCIETYRLRKVNVTKDQLCAGGENKDSCTGDSGGPLMYPQQGKFYLIGIVSFGIGCAEPGYPGVYTRVSQYLDWVSDKIR